jgi:hypothetical protein
MYDDNTFMNLEGEKIFNTTVLLQKQIILKWLVQPELSVSKCIVLEQNCATHEGYVCKKVVHVILN